jgi:hypothetical protein
MNSEPNAVIALSLGLVRNRWPAGRQLYQQRFVFGLHRDNRNRFLYVGPKTWQERRTIYHVGFDFARRFFLPLSFLKKAAKKNLDFILSKTLRVTTLTTIIFFP